MKRTILTSILMALVLLLNGCVVSQGHVYTPELTQISSVSVPIRLIPYEFERIDRFGYDFALTGPFWTGRFTDNEEIDETFTIVTTESAEELGFSKSTITYFVIGELSCGGMTYPIKAQGSRSYTTDQRRIKAIRDAIERAIESVVDSAIQFIATCRAVENKSGPDADDIYTELTKLDELREKGIISQEEFEALKKKILEAQ